VHSIQTFNGQEIKKFYGHDYPERGRPKGLDMGLARDLVAVERRFFSTRYRFFAFVVPAHL